MSTSGPYYVNYEVGDLVIVLHQIEFHGQVAETGEVALIVRIYSREVLGRDIYDCRLKLKCGDELDVWFGEIHKLISDDE